MFRGGVTYVSVDAYPRRDGKVVEGLKAQDFEVLEDGKPQKIDTFEFVRIDSNPVDTDRRDPSSQAESDRLAADPRVRVFVVYLDLYHTSIAGGYYTQRPVVDFLTRTIGSGDVFGFMTPETSVAGLIFGRRTETIENQLSTFWTWGQEDRIVLPRTPFERKIIESCSYDDGLAERLIAGHREIQLMTSLENLVQRLRDLRDERKNVLFVSGGWIPKRPAPLNQPSGGSGEFPQVGVGPGGRLGLGQRVSPGSDRSFCDTQISEINSFDAERHFRDLLQAARRANVSFYPVDTGGLRTAMTATGINNAGVGPGGRTDTLRELAENTDGIAIVNTNDLSGAVRRVADDLSAYYLIGYNSTNPTQDGRYREISVKVKQPGVKVTARRGYLAPSAAVMAKALAAAPATGPSPVDSEIGRLARLRADAEVFTYAALGSRSLDVIAELSSRQAEAAPWNAGASVDVSATNGTDTASGSGRIEAGTRSALVRLTLPTDARDWQVRVRAEAAGASVDERTTAVSAGGAALGVPLVYRAAPSLRAPLKPVADFVFRRNERLHVEWPVRQALDQRLVRLLDRKGQPLPVTVPLTERPATETSGPMLAVDLNLAAFADGDYVFEVTAGNGATSDRSFLAFRIAR